MFHPHEPDKTSCIPCGGGTSTKQDGSDAASDCLTYCAPGKERDDATGNCVDCLIGFYKHNNNNLFMNCTACPDNYVTAATMSTSSSQCTIRACLAGTKRNVGDTACEGCPRGTFQNLNYQTTCNTCPGTTSTKQENSTSQSQCDSYCNSGYQKDTNNQCIPCDRGYYKDNNVDVFSDCTLCPIDRITPSTKAESENDCTQGNCTAGYKIVGNGCEACVIGTYQPNKWKTSCISCPAQKTTVYSNSTAESDCILSCDPGNEDKNGVCVKCAVGYFKPEKKADSCTKCPSGFITSDVGSTSQTDCDVRDCDSGYKVVNNVCEECGYDQFQPLKNRPTCNACPTGYITFQVTTAIASSECKVNCTSGTEINPGTSSPCRDCARGYYRDSNDRSTMTCQMCPVDKITPLNQRGSTAADCTIRNCTTPGQYRNPTTNACLPCPIAKYSNIKWQDACTDCPLGYTTETTGNTDQSSCKLDCPSGQQENSGNCEACAKGYYRDKTTSFRCQACTGGYTTLGTGSTSSTACNASPCAIGERFNTNTQVCEKCPLNYYQHSEGQFSCTLCPNGRYTDNVGSISETFCKSKCANANRNNCSANSVCQDDATNANGYLCQCNTNYQLVNNVCTHKCDTGYCLRGSCIRTTANVYCSCPDDYSGDRCESRKTTTGLSNTEKIIAGAVSGGVGLLILILLIVCCCTMSGRKNATRKTVFREAPYQDFDKASLFNTMQRQPPQAILYDNYGGTTPRMLQYRDPSPGSYGYNRSMQQLPEITFDNAAYNGDPAIYKSNV